MSRPDAVVGLAAPDRRGARRLGREHVAFPNGMVDRITPATTERERRSSSDEFGIEDNWPVFCEQFKQWVLEDHFPAGRPALEKVGVQFVTDVAPFELMKIRILNGGHAVIAYPAGLMDIHFVHEAMEEPLVRGFLAQDRERGDHPGRAAGAGADPRGILRADRAAASPTRRSATPSGGSASMAPTASRNSSCRPSPTG